MGRVDGWLLVAVTADPMAGKNASMMVVMTVVEMGNLWVCRKVVWWVRGAGWTVGCNDGESEGSEDGLEVGLDAGRREGRVVGCEDVCNVGWAVGVDEG